jgi:hypothetical protein
VVIFTSVFCWFRSVVPKRRQIYYLRTTTVKPEIKVKNMRFRKSLEKVLLSLYAIQSKQEPMQSIHIIIYVVQVCGVGGL